MLVGAFDEMVVSPTKASLFEAFLHDVPAEVGLRAVSTWIATESKPPSIAQLRHAVAVAGGTAAPGVDEAWAEVRRELGRVGSHGVPRWSHPAVRDAVAAIGWGALCASIAPAIDRAHFAKAYEAATRRSVTSRAQGLVRALQPAMAALIAGAPAPAPAALPAAATGKPARGGRRG